MDFGPAVAQTELSKYRILGPKCGLRVSPLQLGAMSIGDAWSSRMGSLGKEQAFELLDTFVAEGGNFIDTASNYQVSFSAETPSPSPRQTAMLNPDNPPRTSKARSGSASG